MVLRTAPPRSIRMPRPAGSNVDATRARRCGNRSRESFALRRAVALARKFSACRKTRQRLGFPGLLCASCGRRGSLTSTSSGEGSGTVETLDRIRHAKPSVLVTDLDMPEVRGSDFIPMAKGRSHPCAHSRAPFTRHMATLPGAFRRGADGYGLKGSSSELLIQAIRAVAARGRLQVVGRFGTSTRRRSDSTRSSFWFQARVST